MFTRIAIVNRGEAAMRLIHAVRDLNAQDGRAPSGRSRSTPTRNARRRSRGRPTRRTRWVLPRHAPTSTWPSSSGCWSSARRTRSGSGGVRRRGPRVRRPVRAPRRDLHRTERRRDAPAGRQDRVQAPRAGGRGAGRALERGGVDTWRRRWSPPNRRLPAHAQGDRRRGWPGHPQGRLGRRPRGRLPAHPRRGRARGRAHAQTRERRRAGRSAGQGRRALRRHYPRRTSELACASPAAPRARSPAPVPRA